MNSVRSSVASTVGVGLFGLIALVGCTGDDSGATADCDVLLRLDDTQYRSVTVTDQEPVQEYATVELSRCDDGDTDQSGAVFGDDPDRVEAWTFDGYRGDVVLGVRLADSWQVFIDESVTQDERERIVADLS